jgi:hypothetical protein
MSGNTGNIAGCKYLSGGKCNYLSGGKCSPKIAGMSCNAGSEISDKKCTQKFP